MTRRLTILAHFDGRGEVKPYVVRYLQALRELSERVVFVSTAPELDAAPVRELADEIITVENRGYDFGMWQAALQDVELDSWDELLLTNSSIFGPVGDLGAVFEAMADRPADFWGMTDNMENRWHVQSYFLVFRRTALLSPALRAFFASVLPYRTKWQVIYSYELGLTTFLVEAGLRPAVFSAFTDLWSQRKKVLKGRFRRHRVEKCPNTTVFLPERLLDMGMPLVKVEALRDNPGGLDLERVKAAMAARGYPLELVHVGDGGGAVD